MVVVGVLKASLSTREVDSISSTWKQPLSVRATQVTPQSWPGHRACPILNANEWWCSRKAFLIRLRKLDSLNCRKTMCPHWYVPSEFSPPPHPLAVLGPHQALHKSSAKAVLSGRRYHCVLFRGDLVWRASSKCSIYRLAVQDEDGQVLQSPGLSDYPHDNTPATTATLESSDCTVQCFSTDLSHGL